MNIILANNYHYVRGGADRVYIEEAALLREAGHRVAFFSRHHPKNLQSEYSSYFASAMDFEDRRLLSMAAVPFRMLYSFEAKRNMMRLIRDTGAELVHAHNIYGRLTTSVIDAARTCGIPFFMTAHDYKLVCPAYSMLNHGKPCRLCLKKGYYHCLLTRCHKDNIISSAVYTVESYFNRILKKYEGVSRILCPSRFMMGLLLEGGIDPAKLVFVHYPVRTAPAPPEPIGPCDYVLFAGRVSPEKGLMTLLKAMRGLDFKLKVAGEGPVLKECMAYASENAMKNVEFLGYQSGDSLVALYRGAAAVIVPSEWYENAPLSVLEAFSNAKPVIATTMGGLPELIRDGVSGYFFEAFDHETLRERIRDIALRPSLAKEMGLAAWNKVATENSFKAHNEALMQLYASAREEISQ